MSHFTFSRSTCGLLVIDVQEKLFPLVEHSCEVMLKIQTAVRGFQIMKLPIYATEQYPQGLGSTVQELKGWLGPSQEFFTKFSFSCVKDEKFKQFITALPIKQWVLAGIEAHVCVLQTARDLLTLGKEVAVLNDAISSRSIYDFSTAIAEMRDMGVRVTSTETILFELISNCQEAEFKQIINLIK
jgi:nicotinamidase-related amidase